MEPRTNKVIIIVGTKGTGKTDLEKEMLFKASKRFPKSLIVDTFDNPVWHNLATYNAPERVSLNVPSISIDVFPRWKKGVARMFSSDRKELFSAIEKYARNTFLIFEDSRKIVKDRLTDDVTNFVLDSKQKNLDIIFVYHALRRVPIELLDIADILILKKTNEAKLPSKFDMWPEIIQMMEELKADKNRFAFKALQLN